MNDPHVDALIYVIEHDESSDYSLAKTVETEHTSFRLRLEDNEARFELKEHYPTRHEAQQAIQPFIQQWELRTSLKSGLGTFTLKFKRSEMIDGRPTPGVISVSPDPISFNFKVNNLSSNKGGADQARHEHGTYQPLTSLKVQFLEKSVAAMIVRGAIVAEDPNQPMDTIDCSNLQKMSP